MRAIGPGFLLPERGVGLEVVHQEFGALEGGVAVGREGHDLDDSLAGGEGAVAVDDRGGEESEAGFGLIDDRRELVDGQFGIAFQRQGG